MRVTGQNLFCCELRYVRYGDLRKQRALEDSSIRVRYDLSALLASFQKLLLISMTMRLIVTTDNCAFGKYVNHIVCILSIFTPNNNMIFSILLQMYKGSFLIALKFPPKCFKYIFFGLF